MVDRLFNRFGVTLWFFSGSLACSTAMYLSLLVLDLPAAALGADFWLLTAARISAFGALSGLMVDALRFVASIVWPAKRPFPLDAGDFLSRNLAG